MLAFMAKSKEFRRFTLKNRGCAGVGFVIPEYAVSPRENILFAELEMQRRIHVFSPAK